MDPKSWFSEYRIHKTEISMSTQKSLIICLENLIRVDGSTLNKEVYFFGTDNTQIIARLQKSGISKEQTTLKKVSQTKTPNPTIFCRVTKDSKLVQIYQKSNNFEVKSPKGKSLQTLPGIKEEPYTYEMYRSFRYAKEDLFPLWRRGGTSLVLLEPNSFSVIKDFKKFWPNGYIPMRCCINKDMSRIYGFSFSEKDGIFTILDIDKQNQTIRDKTIKIPNEQKWIGMEMATSAELLIIANSCKIVDKISKKSKGFLKLMAVDLSTMKIKIVAHKDFKNPIYKTSQLFRKIKGYDYFVVASGPNLSIFGFDGKKFGLLNVVENVYKDRIIDIAIFDNYMVPIAKTSGLGVDGNVKILEFNVSSYNSLVKLEESKFDDIGVKKESLVEGVFSEQVVKRISVPPLGIRDFLIFFSWG